MKSTAWPRRNRKARKSAAPWPRSRANWKRRERAGQEQAAALDRRSGKSAAATRRCQCRAHRKQSGAGDRGAACAPRSASSSNPWNSASGELAQVVEQRRARNFIVHRTQGAGGIGNPGFAAQIERLQHEREQVNAQTAELLAQKQAQETRRDRARGALARTAAAG